MVRFRNNPLLAAFLGTAVTGLGHLYLKRWLRALGWLGAVILASALLVPESARSAISSGSVNNVASLVPVFLISAASVVDAYLIAKARRTATSSGAARQTGRSHDDGGTVACPACGKSINPELGFCHWCTTEFESFEVSGQQGKDGTDSH
jgi:hypothetical protein